MALIEPKFTNAANALMHVSIKQKYFQFVLEHVQQDDCRPQIIWQAVVDYLLRLHLLD